MDKENLKIRIFENINIGGTHYKRALGFTYRLSTDFKMEVFVYQYRDEDQVSFKFGNGHIRMTVRESFKNNLGSEKPLFEAVWKEYSQRDGVIKVKDSAYRHHLR